MASALKAPVLSFVRGPEISAKRVKNNSCIASSRNIVHRGANPGALIHVDDGLRGEVMEVAGGREAHRAGDASSTTCRRAREAPRHAELVPKS